MIVVYISERYLQHYKKGKLRKAIRVAIFQCTDYITDIVNRIRIKLPVLLFGDNYFDFTLPEDVGWDGERFDFSVIKFRERYWRKVRAIIGTGEGDVGIHIRRTDHCTARKESSTDIFIHNMNEALTKRPDIKFF